MENNNGLTNSDFAGEGHGIEGHPNEEMPINEELAHRVSQDARKVILGEMTEAEFYKKYHDDYLKEFGTDERPVEQVEKVETKPESPLSKQISRRSLLKAGGLAMAGLLGAKVISGQTGKALAAPIKKAYNGTTGGNAEQPQAAPTNVQMGWVVDLEQCDGCLSCVFACQNHNFNDIGVLWIYVMAFKDINREEPNFFIRTCQHCGNPPCVKVCPVRARHKRTKDGLVLTDYDLCIGCRYCMVTCPYGANYFQWDLPYRKNVYHETLKDYRGKWVIGNPPKGCMGKCTFCPDRQDDGRKNMVCALVCPKNVIHFGDIHDPNSEPMQYLAQRQKAAGGTLSVWRLLETQGTKPSIIFIGQQPTRAAVPVDGPVKYSDWGLVETRHGELGGPRPWFLDVFGGSK